MPSAPIRSRRTVMRVGLVVAASVSVVALAGVGYVRFAPHTLQDWHQDPVTADVTDTPNWYRLTPASAEVDNDLAQEGRAPTFDVPLDRLAAAFEKVATDQPRVERLAGSVEDGFVTYVQRSTIVGFPDYVSVRFLRDGAGSSTVAIYSRSRYGYSDGGVNRERVERWISELQRQLG